MICFARLFTLIVALLIPVARVPARARLLVQNRYFARLGKSQEVYAWRQHASDVLRQLGLSAGQVFRGAGGEEPDAVWQVVLDSVALVRESRIAQESPEFQEVMRHMATFVRRFENANYLERRLAVDVKDTVASARPGRFGAKRW